ncbi:hypothetical protein NEUTE2DRAFT_135120 [Neurospora tetrasperma FGSC 2509]|nr:hypothetical protein NEUTE2DRAFT_135120 [Neurospora tetrasperma FGSC 2509]
MRRNKARSEKKVEDLTDKTPSTPAFLIFILLTMTRGTTAIIKNTYRNGDGHRILRCCTAASPFSPFDGLNSTLENDVGSARLTRKEQRPETTTTSVRQSLCDHSRSLFICMIHPIKARWSPCIQILNRADVSHLRPGGGNPK